MHQLKHSEPQHVSLHAPDPLRRPTVHTSGKNAIDLIQVLHDASYKPRHIVHIGVCIGLVLQNKRNGVDHAAIAQVNLIQSLQRTLSSFMSSQASHSVYRSESSLSKISRHD